MEEKIEWSKSGHPIRKAVIELCGWANKSGKATPHGLVIARTEWNELSPAAKRVLSNHGINQ